MSLSLDENGSEIFQYINLICISYFAFECLFKIIGLGYKNYFADQSNLFDMSFFIFYFIVVTLLSWFDFFTG